MYKYHLPKPIAIKLTDPLGWELRQKAAQYLAENRNNTGAERGSSEEQGFGALAEMVIRNQLGMPEINPVEHPLAYDILLPSGVKADVKCRGGALPFQEEYASSDGLPREAKHNIFARQIHDSKLDTDIYIMTHLETPKVRTLPGTKRQKKWILYVCGWVTKERVTREGVYLPRGSLSERGRTWMQYRGQEVEFYNKNLNGLSDVRNLLDIEKKNVDEDKVRIGDLNVTWVDAVRIVYDLVGRGILGKKHLNYVIGKSGLEKTVKPILNPNQYHHVLKWLKAEGLVSNLEIAALGKLLPEEPFTGI